MKCQSASEELKGGDIERHASLDRLCAANKKCVCVPVRQCFAPPLRASLRSHSLFLGDISRTTVTFPTTQGHVLTLSGRRISTCTTRRRTDSIVIFCGLLLICKNS
ncbi:hypothetical protein UPYG_G00190910 [Umbra pygmaea]|uniref:Uncharacterized protein n=1 Tax=Umbra pygmaea TaxID=75934 RepID=A0ABD0WXG5_UMBPY